jgi:hypothetical protein
MTDSPGSGAVGTYSTRIFPRGRRDLLVTGLGDEIQLYDRAQNRSYHLNQLAAITWEESDGHTNVANLRRRVEIRLGTAVAEELVWHTLQELERQGLVSELGLQAPRFTRGQLIKGGLIWTLALLPIIRSMEAPAGVSAIPVPAYATNTPTPTPTRTPVPTNTPRPVRTPRPTGTTGPIGAHHNRAPTNHPTPTRTPRPGHH